MDSYVKQLNYFAKFSRLKHLSGQVQLLWYKLMQLNNECYWQKYFTVTNQRLMDEAAIGNERTLIKARKELTKLGLIKFQRGFKNHPSTYSMVPLHVSESGIICPVGMENDEYIEFNEIYNGDPTLATIVEDTPTETKETKKTKKSKKPKIDYTGIIDYYNAHRNRMSKVQVVTDDRKKKMRARIEEHSIEKLKQVIDMAERSDFLNGLVEPRGGGKPFKASFDWLLKPSNFVKVLEGNYENMESSSSVTDYLIGVGMGQIDVAGNPIKQEETFDDYVIEGEYEELEYF